MRHLILLAGPAGSGKSTYIKNNFNLDRVNVISSDEIRLSYTGSYRIIPRDINVVYNDMIDQTNDIFLKNEDAIVVLDSTFLTDKRRNYFLDRINNVDKVTLILLKAHDINTILTRNLSRQPDKQVPHDVVMNMIKSYKDPDNEYISRYNEIIEYFID